MWLVAAFALAGGLAQLVDGTLGMGFGVTSATVLLALGVAPATASAAVSRRWWPPCGPRLVGEAFCAKPNVVPNRQAMTIAR